MIWKAPGVLQILLLQLFVFEDYCLFQFKVAFHCKNPFLGNPLILCLKQ